jgi:hypothetical protein
MPGCHMAVHVWATRNHLILQVHFHMSTIDSSTFLPVHSATVPSTSVTNHISTLATCQILIGLAIYPVIDHFHVSYLPCHQHMSYGLYRPSKSSMLSHLYRRATCHHYKGDTCHSLTGPLYLSTSASVCLFILPCVTFRSFHVNVDCAFHISFMTIRLVQPASTWHYTDCMHCTINMFFAYLEKRTNHHNLSIQNLFEPVQVALGSYR